VIGRYQLFLRDPFEERVSLKVTDHPVMKLFDVCIDVGDSSHG